MNDDIKNEFYELHEKFFSLKCLFMCMDNTLNFCSSEYPDIYYLYEFSQIIADEFEKTETLFDKLETNLY